MKFGKKFVILSLIQFKLICFSLIKNKVPEFSSKYIDYKVLKKEISAIFLKSKNPTDLTSFFSLFDSNLESVNTFFNLRKKEITRRIDLILKKYNLDLLIKNHQQLDIEIDEKEDLVSSLFSLKSELQKLLWYLEINNKGFTKILKKLDKKLNISLKSNYMESKVMVLSSATTATIELFENIDHWLSYINDANSSNYIKTNDTKNSIVSIPSVFSFTTDPVLIEKIEESIRKNDTENFQILVDKLRYKCLSNFFINLLRRSLLIKSFSCAEVILSCLNVFIEEEEINDRNLIHKLIISIGRNKEKTSESIYEDTISLPSIDRTVYSTLKINNLRVFGRNFSSSNNNSISIDDIEPLGFLLSKLEPPYYKYLLGRDVYNRLPLHYAVGYGLIKNTQLILDYMIKWNQLNPETDNLNDSKWRDSEGYTPLHQAILIRNIEILDILQSMNKKVDPLSYGTKIIYEEVENLNSYSALALAVKFNYDEIVYQLLESGLDINHQDKDGKSALHIAVHLGNVNTVKVLLNGTKFQKQDTELVENVYGWTPLFIAAIEGFPEIVKLLVSVNARIDKTDFSGWTALEHAVFRGHMNCIDFLMTPEIREYVQKAIVADKINEEKNHKFFIDHENDIKLQKNMKTELSKSIENLPMTEIATSKDSHHQCIEDKTVILITLGSTNRFKNITPVEINRTFLTEASITQLNSVLSLIVTAKNAQGTAVVDFSIHDRIETEPIVFTTTNYPEVQIFFDIVPSYGKTKDKLIGRAVALLSSVKTYLGKARESLNSELKVPIIEANTLSIIGSINFELRVVTPFKHPNITSEKSSTYWESLIKTRVIGHRGLGKNQASRKSLQLGENTLESFIAAANLGASYVEFDVQLTKDHVPVIYHDFLVSETGVDAPVHSLTLEQFLALSDTKQDKPLFSTRLDQSVSFVSTKLDALSMKRSKSQYFANLQEENELYERIKHTRDYRVKGYKGNARGQSIQCHFMTLEDAFKKIPIHVGFNIECKYAMLYEAENEEMDSVAIELNQWVDTVLKFVFDYKKDRDIIFSSFHPEICLLLSLKQSSIPIMFLTDAGATKMTDIRSSSLQEAIRFATRWNLLGIVSECSPLILCPRLINVIKNSGLVCVTYGSENNIPEKVNLQMKAGLDAVIVDSVLEIRKGLTMQS
ncbi:unnamed protein product [Pneumocystis jirovecii]|uniref:GP-PDE domain-containing protein n=2 Tax=Pneumocystis jirovecii TaxID=42068 RepID=L0PHE9_PNEJI|nr:glycerophosphocholine phosphodiesterase [Pneumocystis jirovecii RU7]KTW27525.1 hypothetical protein T551_03024 [Pneumocystis jirovecii RU7]CCJ31080.1 unnamed protein product [Pneumocystis jirovecii]